MNSFKIHQKLVLFTFFSIQSLIAMYICTGLAKEFSCELFFIFKNEKV